MTPRQWLASTLPRELLHALPRPVSKRKGRLLATSWCRLAPDLLQDEDARRAVEVAEWYADGGSGNTRNCPWFPDLVLTDLGYLQHAQRIVGDVTTSYWIVRWWPFCAANEDIGEGVRDMIASLDRLRENLSASLCVLFRDIVGNPLCPWNSQPCSECQGTGEYELLLGSGTAPCAECDGKGWQDNGEAQLLLEDCLRWQDGVIPRLAQAIYEERAWDRLPILADALEEAGCNNKAILQHCRGTVLDYNDGGCAYWHTDVSGPQLTPEYAAQAHQHTRGCWVVDLVLGRK